MAEVQRGAKGSPKTARGFSEEERAAVRDAVREQKVVWGKNREEDERAVRAKIATFPEPDRSMGTRLHAIIRSTAPVLLPRLWYGMPAYTKDGEVLCFFQPAHKFQARYGTLGFSDNAHLDDGEMWATGFALTGLTARVEARIAALVKKAAG